MVFGKRSKVRQNATQIRAVVRCVNCSRTLISVEHWTKDGKPACSIACREGYEKAEKTLKEGKRIANTRRLLVQAKKYRRYLIVVGILFVFYVYYIYFTE